MKTKSLESYIELFLKDMEKNNFMLRTLPLLFFFLINTNDLK